MSDSQPVRCPWLDLSKPDYIAYHDTEWGVPIDDDPKMFEFLTLESAQAGLSWYTVLKKRPNYRRAFAEFRVERVARFGTRDVERLMQDEGIIRNRLKIQSAIGNAQRFLKVQEEFGTFCNYLWRFVDGRTIVNRPRKLADYAATSPESDAMSKDLKQRGFKFVGSTICYAHMQAAGMVNDHSLGCFRRNEIIQANRD